MDLLRDDTALFGVVGHAHAARLVARGLVALAPRCGERGAGMAASDGRVVRSRHGTTPGEALLAAAGALAGRQAIGQLGDGLPVLAQSRAGRVAVALAGRFTNAGRVRRELDDAGASWWTSHEAEIVLQLVARSGQRTTVNRIVDALWRLEGGFSMLICTEDRVVAARDPRGLRPLWLGRVEGAVVFATEDAAILAVGGEPTREVEPGELVIVDAEALRTVAPFPRRVRAACVQELVSVGGRDVRSSGRASHDVRVRLGERLARERGCERGEVVVGLAGPGADAARGFARAAKLPVDDALTTGPEARATRAAVAGKRVVLVAASLTTGEALKAAAAAMLAAGAVEIHARIASPPLRSACVYGVEGPPSEALATPVGEADVAHAVLAARLGVDSLAFLPLGPFDDVIGAGAFCAGCLGGDWPIAPEADLQLPLFRGTDG